MNFLMAILLMLLIIRPCLHSDCASSGGSKEADHLRSGKASLIGEELLVTRVATPEPMSMKAMG